MLARLIKDCVTGIDGESYDVGRVLWVVGAAIMLGLAIFDVIWKAHQFDVQNFGIGYGSYLLGGGAGIGMKAKTEPKGDAP